MARALVYPETGKLVFDKCRVPTAFREPKLNRPDLLELGQVVLLQLHHLVEELLGLRRLQFG